MSHLFTASWIDRSANVCALVDETFQQWITMKQQVAYGMLQVSRHTSESPGRSRFAAGLTEIGRDGTSTTTEITAVHSLDPFADGPACGWITVDVHTTAEDQHGYLPSPWLVQTLIARGVEPRFGDDLLTVAPTVLRGTDAGEILAEQVTMFGRRLPLIALSSVPDLFAQLRRERSTLADIAAQTALSCAGLATVALIDEACRARFNTAVGPDLALEPGALRVFRGDADPSVVGDARRHPQRRANDWYSHPVAAPAYVGRLLAGDAVRAAREAVAV